MTDTVAGDLLSMSTFMGVLALILAVPFVLLMSAWRRRLYRWTPERQARSEAYWAARRARKHTH